MAEQHSPIHSWLVDARAAVDSNSFTSSHLDNLEQITNGATLKQRLLYLHAAGPGIQTPVIGYALHETTEGYTTGGIDPLAPKSPYASVHDAILDGWRVIHFPQQNMPFEDREIDLIGYEFILEKMEVADA
jgi:hypothetical protein